MDNGGSPQLRTTERETLSKHVILGIGGPAAACKFKLTYIIRTCSNHKTRIDLTQNLENLIKFIG